MKNRIKRYLIGVSAALLPILAVMGYTGGRLIKGEHTDLSDLAGVISVHISENYYVAQTSAIDRYDDGMAECCDGNVMQCIIVSEFAQADRLLEENGCTEYDRMGDKGYYTTADGRKFFGTYRMRCIPLFCTFEIEGVTIEDITNG